MSYEFFLQKIRDVQCVRLLTDKCNETQKWISLNIPYVEEFHETKFRLSLEKTSPLVLVLSQVGPESTSLRLADDKARHKIFHRP